MTVSNLSPGSCYNFYVAAGNPVGFGKSVKFEVCTPRPVPPPLPKTGKIVYIVMDQSVEIGGGYGLFCIIWCSTSP